MDDLRSIVTISRTHPTDVGERQVIVRLDGGDPVRLVFGETVSGEVQPGRHRLRVHNTLFWKTRDLVLSPGEHARFTAVNRTGWATFGLLIVLGAAPLYLTLEREG